MVVSEVGHAMFTTGLMRANELIVDVVGLHCFEGGLIVLRSPWNVELSFVAWFCWRKDLEHEEAIEESLTLCRLESTVIFTNSRFGHPNIWERYITIGS